MNKLKKDISLIFGVITIIIIMTVLVGVINNRNNNNSFKFPTSNPKNISFPSEQLETNTGDSSSKTLNNTLSGANLSNEQVKKTEQDEIDQSIIKQIELASTINTSGLLGNLELCNNIEDSNKKEECINNSYASIASSKNDSNYCKKITDNIWKNRCLDSLYFDDAILKNNQNTCNKISDSKLKYNCLSTIIFSKVNDTNYIGGNEICNSLNTSDKLYCQNKFNTEKDVENLQTAISKADITLCKKIVSVELKTKCNDVINLKIAVSSMEKARCTLINDINLKEQCNVTLTKILSK